MMCRFTKLLLLCLALCAPPSLHAQFGEGDTAAGAFSEHSPLLTRPPLAYDAEYDIGLVSDNSTDSVAAANTTKLNAALAAQYRTASFAFAHSPPGPVVRPIRFPAKAFYFKGPIITSTRIGGALFGGGGCSYFMLPDQYAAGGTAGGAVTRFYRIDGENGGPIIRLRWTGFRIENIELNGRPWLVNSLTESVAFGSYHRTRTGIEVEGRVAIATGLHTIRNVMINECDYAICCRAGYYNDSDNGADPFTASNPGFVSDENHADQGIVENLTCFGCHSIFRSENQQSVGWSFRDLRVNSFQYTAAGGQAVIVFDIVRGGDITATGNIMVNNFFTTILRVRDYSPSNRKNVIGEVKQDGGMAGVGGSYLTLFEVTAASTHYSTGTVAVSGTGVTGTGTAWTNSIIPPGARIGFGTTNPGSVSVWYTIGSIDCTTTNHLTLTGSAGTITAGTAYVIDQDQFSAYSGASSLNFVSWPVRMTGRISNDSGDYDFAKLIVIPSGLLAKGIGRSNVLLDIDRLPMDNFTLLGSGPWAKPN